MSSAVSKAARQLGKRGGLQRARRLSQERRSEIARLGALARVDSLRLARRIRNNFGYVMAMRQLNPPEPVCSTPTTAGRLPGIYAQVEA